MGINFFLFLFSILKLIHYMNGIRLMNDVFVVRILDKVLGKSAKVWYPIPWYSFLIVGKLGR